MLFPFPGRDENRFGVGPMTKSRNRLFPFCNSFRSSGDMAPFHMSFRNVNEIVMIGFARTEKNLRFGAFREVIRQRRGEQKRLSAKLSHLHPRFLISPSVTGGYPNVQARQTNRNLVSVVAFDN